MFLRSITIRGFKSFADKTVLEFMPGVSVIVGPNGSGKSNLVDAISWVLGEQGARSLRGGHMADVIFAGTPSRPALGMAEVKLVIDNSAGRIPVPMSEIEVARTIFRSGESEYRINGQVVRLLDVQELLSETGIGRALHTVVGQGQLEEVLLAKPEERRKYIEEAAGIAKHRRRKERAERKLGNLDQDLLRLADVLSELRRQLKPLRQQAEMAKKHETLTAEAEDLSRKLAAARLRALLREKERRAEGWQRGLDERTAARERLDALDGDVLAAADARATASTALADAELAFRSTGRGPPPRRSRRSATRWSARARPASSSPRRPRGRRGSTRSTTRSRRVEAVAGSRRRRSSRRASASSRQAERAFREAEQERAPHRGAASARRRGGRRAPGRGGGARAIARIERARARAARRLARVRSENGSPRSTPSAPASRPRSRPSTTSPRR